MSSAPAVLAAAACAALLVTSSGGRLQRVLPRPARGRGLDRTAAVDALVTLSHRPLRAAGLAAILAAALAGPVAGLVAAVVAGLLARALARRRGAKLQAETTAAAGRSIAGLAAELRAGRTPIEALDVVARTAPSSVAKPLVAAAQAAKLGADPALALARYAVDVPAMDRLAGCWRIAARTGAGLAEVADALAGDLRAAERQRGALAAETAGSRASALLLAGLPLVGIALGASLGARPLHFLFHTAPGAAVLVAGLLFEAAGLWWTDRLLRGVEQSP